jgi:hypothetical protein
MLSQKKPRTYRVYEARTGKTLSLLLVTPHLREARALCEECAHMASAFTFYVVFDDEQRVVFRAPAEEDSGGPRQT